MVSGGHLNPAVTVAGAIVGRFKRVKVIHYLIAQYLGAFVAAAFTYLVYIGMDVIYVFAEVILLKRFYSPDSFKAYHDAFSMNKTTASIFATYPKSGLSIFGSIIDQVKSYLAVVGLIFKIILIPCFRFWVP